MQTHWYKFEAIVKLKVGNKINSFLGDIFYEVSLFHYGVFALFTMMDPDMDSGIFAIISVAATVVLTYVFNRICKPMVRLFR